MKNYYSEATGTFYSSELFGAKTMHIVDPAFKWPMIEVPDPDHQGEGEAPMIKVRDESIKPPMIEVPNPDCNLPADAVEISDDYHQELLNGQGIKRITADENGYPVLTDPPPIPLADLAAQKRAELDNARDTAFAEGLEYEINGEPDTVQTRPQDQINLLGLQAQAQRLIVAGQPDATLTFRGLQNVNRELTASEIDKLTLAALSHIEEIYQKSWDLKDQLDAAFEAEEREVIEAISW
ncbi:DUF4376 domain-containing protein [Vreelandella nanhaiensis]|uniref:DUF4376 domain-containing protein n=1 Tax=Vreelandella nanhaiensis TaxID=1258546 RepID=A0A3S0YDP2_9GAMM|nr:DUF4376 domain-containing protein [Halomonas nanhaiensis]RUR27703.1 DUF4376 domain-containing protein [Halomonas nanhaiensis]